MSAWYGYAGKVLKIDLTERKVEVEELDREIAQKFMGSRGVGMKYLYDAMDPAVDALSPENPLLFVTGPLTGTGAPAAGRYMVMTKGPLTGAIAESNAGGNFAVAMKYAGYDLIIIQGKADGPVYLWVDDDHIEIRDATHLWGKQTTDTEFSVIAETDPRARVACIGPAGEKQVLYACVMNDHGRAAGRSGVGAVMGSKNLKAIAIKGTGGIKVADPVGFRKRMMAVRKEFDTEYPEHFHQTGTPGVVPLVQEVGALPHKNFQYGQNPNWSMFEGERLADTLSVKKRKGMACPGCPVACGRVTRVTDPEFASEGDGPEYETIALLGSSCGVDNLGAIAKAGFICNEMGMDTITAGATIACAMELYEKGHLTEKEIGMPLVWGDAHAIVDFCTKIGMREGFGDVMAEGSYRLATKYGHPEYHMGVKKLEFAGYDPRALQGQGLGYATNSRGACHIRGEVHDLCMYNCLTWHITKDRGITKVNSREWKDKPILAKEVQDWFCIVDANGMCNFMNFMGMDEDKLRELVETATGFDIGGYKGLMEIGERIFNLERLFNLKAGLTCKDDTLPKRMLEEPMPEGPAKGDVVHLDEMLPEYYRLRGWTEEGVPTEEKLKSLGLMG